MKKLEQFFDVPIKIQLIFRNNSIVIDLNKSLLVSNLDLKPAITIGSDYVSCNLVSATLRLCSVL